MPTKIGHFEILSELAKSPTGAVYKANDPESGQTIALKAIQLNAFGDSSEALEKALLAEADKTKILSCQNITNVYGAGEMEGQFCAAMEYVQGNSIATMLARKEGFSIWDLLDIGRQLCNGLDHAASHDIVHYSLEPAKIMCGWDGTVKILGFGVSSVGNFAHLVTEGMPATLHYMSPEQVQGLPMDGRSNLFSLGAIFYEMVTEQRAFEGDEIESARQSIIESTPAPPIHVNPKVHPLLSNLIMKALAKAPADRYQRGRELLDDLEKCKESRPAAAKKVEPAKGPAVSNQSKSIAQSKFVTSAAAQPAAPATAGLVRPTSVPSNTSAKSPGTAASAAARAETKSPLGKPASTVASPKSAAAAAGAGSSVVTPVSSPVSAPMQSPVQAEEPELDLSNQFISASVKATLAAAEKPSAQMSSAVADEPEIETFEAPQIEETAPKVAVDPLMAEAPKTGGAGTSFSEIDELPPLKEVYVAPPPPPPPVEPMETVTPRATTFNPNLKPRLEEKPKVQPREVAEKAIKEIKNVPPKLMLYTLAGAGALILAIGIGVTIYIHSFSSDDDAGAPKAVATAEAPAQPESSQPAATTQTQPPAAQPEEIQQPATPERQPVANVRLHPHKKAPAAPVIVPGQLAVDSTPQGAVVQVDGKSDPSWVTPFALTNLQPGPHSITVSKQGYSTDTRTIAVVAGNRASTMVHLAQLMATLVVKSNPPGADVFVDGRNVGTKTPAQVSVDKGQHVVLVRMMGYLDETMNAQFVLGQTFNFSPTLRPLGNAESIKTVGKMSRLFGGKGAQSLATVSIRTQPKGAQVAINEHIMEKNSPLDVELDPGNYIIDITLTGYASIHKVINVDKGSKVVVDEVMQRQ
jgi:eukaryotic-like serine/threonine-protein kinase